MYQTYNKSCIKCNIIKACGAWEFNGQCPSAIIVSQTRLGDNWG
jgi:hypothetical protein